MCVFFLTQQKGDEYEEGVTSEGKAKSFNLLLATF